MKVIKVDWENHKVYVYADTAMGLIEHDLVTKCAKHSIRGFDSEDLAQELRLHLWRKLDRYDPTKAGFRTWANRVMNNRLKDMYKRTIMPRRDALNDINTCWDVKLPISE